MKNILIFLFLILISLKLPAQKLNYMFEQISPVSGISFNAVTSIQEDKNGFIWLGGGDGVFFYDGIHFNNYSRKQEYCNNILAAHIYDIIKDKKDIIWVCTSLGLMFFDVQSDLYRPVEPFSNKRVEKISQILKDYYVVLADKELYGYNSATNSVFLLDEKIDRITTFYKYSDNSLIVGTTTGNIYEVDLYDSKNNKLIFRKHSDRINTICRDNKWLYVGYENSGIEVINISGENIKSYFADEAHYNSLPDNNVRKIVNRGNGEIWIATYDGLAILVGEKFTVYNNINSTLPSSSIHDIYIDSKGEIWIGTWSGGLAKYSPNAYRFGGENVYLNNKTKFGVVTSFVPSKKKQSVWIGTENNGLYLYNYVSTKFDRRLYPVSFHIKSMIRFGDNILIGAVEGLFVFNEDNNEFEHFHTKTLSKANPIVSCMYVNNNKLYIATRKEGILEYDLTTKKETLYSYENNNLGTSFIWQIFVDKQDNIYACTDKGFFVKVSSQDRFHEINLPSLRRGKCFYCVSPLNYEELLLGTHSNGIYVYNMVTGSIRPLKENDVFSNLEIYSIISMHNNRIWIATNDGIFSFAKEGEEIFRYTEVDGIIGRQFHPLASAIFNDGTVFWGSTVGFNYININSIKYNTVKAEPYPIEIRINNQPLSLYQEIESNSSHIPDIRTVDLPYYLNSISLRISANSLLNSEKNKLKYRLEGYQDDWSIIPQAENIVFTQVPPGKYILCVYAANNDMLWGDNELKISFFIHPPFYATGYAYLFYIILTIAILYFTYRNVKFRIIALKEISSERNQSRINKAIVEERTKFFMNISHELRTPLNLIITPIKVLMEHPLDKETKYHIDVIYRNAERLRHLTEQILDFRYLEVNKMKVDKKNVNLIPLCKDIIGEFDFYIKKKNVDLKFESDSMMRYITCDGHMIEKVIYNLLSNALKYSENEPKITLELKKQKLSDEDYKGVFYVGNRFEGMALFIIISDNGRGIDNDKYNAIFERFNTYHDENQEGSGIGLHLCKEYVVMHGGNIMLKSERGVGSTFTVSLPVVNDLEKQNILTPIVISQSQVEQNRTLESTLEDGFEDNLNLRTVLIVEDNDDVAYYLKKSLSTRYRCLIAKNGKAGLDMAINVRPDIIVMDYTMPIMNGVDCTKVIRNNIKIKDIPVIMLSGAVDTETQKKAVNVGVDVFLAKPIDEGLLIEHIDKLLNKVRNSNGMDLEAKLPQTFIERLDYYLEKNITAPGFDVEMLSSCMNISRSSLFRKIKSETGYNISEYIKEKRLNVAIELIKTGKKNVEELSICCGFNSSSYFCKCFKSKYGVSPKEYIKLNT